MNKIQHSTIINMIKSAIILKLAISVVLITQCRVHDIIIIMTYGRRLTVKMLTDIKTCDLTQLTFLLIGLHCCLCGANNGYKPKFLVNSLPLFIMVQVFTIPFPRVCDLWFCAASVKFRQSLTAEEVYIAEVTKLSSHWSDYLQELSGISLLTELFVTRQMPWFDVCPSVRLSVYLSHAGVVSKRLNE